MSRERWQELFGGSKPIIGMLHLPPLPGSAGYSGEPLGGIIDYVMADVEAYSAAGVSGLIVENQGDAPFSRPEDISLATVAAMTAVTVAVTGAVDVPVGVNCMANGAEQALAIAKGGGGSFIRVSQWVNAYIGNSGLINAAAPRALRFRSEIHAHDVLVFADVHVKHGSHAIVGDRQLADLAKDTAWYGADALVVTGEETGKETSTDDVAICKSATGLPTLIGSGVGQANVLAMLERADGAIVGTSVKVDGVTTNPVDGSRVKALMDLAAEMR